MVRELATPNGQRVSYLLMDCLLPLMVREPAPPQRSESSLPLTVKKVSYALIDRELATPSWMES